VRSTPLLNFLPLLAGVPSHEPHSNSSGEQGGGEANGATPAKKTVMRRSFPPVGVKLVLDQDFESVSGREQRAAFEETITSDFAELLVAEKQRFRVVSVQVACPSSVTVSSDPPLIQVHVSCYFGLELLECQDGYAILGINPMGFRVSSQAKRVPAPSQFVQTHQSSEPGLFSSPKLTIFYRNPSMSTCE